MRMDALVVLLLMANHPAAADDPPSGGLTLVQPSPKPPVSKAGPVRSRLSDALRVPGAPAGELSGLRAVSLREGSAVIFLAGAARSVSPGDRIGAATVKAVGSDRIVLERPQPLVQASATVPNGAVIMVVTFGPGGEARVRTYASMSAAAPPPERR